MKSLGSYEIVTSSRHQVKGWALTKLGNYKEAITNFDRVLAIDPKDKDTLSGKGLVVVLSGLGNHTATKIS